MRRLFPFIVVIVLCLPSLPASSLRVVEWGRNSMSLECLFQAEYVSTQITGQTKKIIKLDTCEIDVGIYQIPISVSSTYGVEGETLTIQALDQYLQVVRETTCIIPVIVESPISLSEYDRSICATTDLVVLDGGLVTVPTDLETYSFRSIFVYGGGKLVVPVDGGLQTDAIYLLANNRDNGFEYAYPQLVVNGSLQNKSNTLYYDYLLDAKHYYNLTLPQSVSVSAICYEDGQSIRLKQTLYIQYYDGGARASGNNGWRDFSSDSLYANVGYTIAAQPQFIQIVAGQPKQRRYDRIRIPLPMQLNAGEVTGDVNIPVVSYPSATGKDNDAGWNLVGNPYLANYGSVEGLTSNGIGLLAFNGQGFEWQGMQRYVVIPNEDGSAYRSELASTAVLPAFNNFFVQIGSGDALNFKMANRVQHTPLRQLEIEEYNEHLVELMLKAANSYDKSGLLIDDNYTDAYEINADLQKFAHNAGANVYFYMDKSELAFAAVNAQRAATSVPIGYIAMEDGEHVFSLDSLYDTQEIASVILYDSVEHVSTNLLLKDYHFSTTKGTYNNRFSISVQIAHQTPTNVIECQFEKDMRGKYLIDGQLVIFVNGRTCNYKGEYIQ